MRLVETKSQQAQSRSITMKTSRLMNRPAAFTLIELLVVITIIGILASMAFPVINGVMAKARKVRALAVIKDLQVAIKGYQTEYNRYPSPPGGSEAPVQTTAGDLISTLLASDSQQAPGKLNPRGIKFIDLPVAKNEKGGLVGASADDYTLVDEWGNPYTVIMDTNGDEKIENPDVGNADSKISSGAPPQLPFGVAVYSNGPDGDDKTKDDITSWRG
jgi:prepilin-type N-terminal cleavage/methylation domain-containing protein